MANNDTRNTAVAEMPVFTTPVAPAVRKDTKSSNLRLVVLYTTPKLTKEALHYAEKLGNGLGVDLRLVEIEVVPYPCPLDEPPINPRFARRRLEALGQGSKAPIRADVVYARDRYEALTRLLDPASLVLIPVKGFGPQMREKRLISKLVKHGHDVLVVPCH